MASFYKTVDWHLLLFSLNNIQSFSTVCIPCENPNILYIDIIILVFLKESIEVSLARTLLESFFFYLAYVFNVTRGYNVMAYVISVSSKIMIQK